MYHGGVPYPCIYPVPLDPIPLPSCGEAVTANLLDSDSWAYDFPTDVAIEETAALYLDDSQDLLSVPNSKGKDRLDIAEDSTPGTANSA